eukprot:COSAG04_NODE_618_length_11896_cov_81.925659_21_plen_79_part_00
MNSVGERRPLPSVSKRLNSCDHPVAPQTPQHSSQSNNRLTTVQLCQNSREVCEAVQPSIDLRNCDFMQKFAHGLYMMD